MSNNKQFTIMKATVNNSAVVANSVSINKDMLNKKKAMKYVKKDIMVESLNLLQGVLVSMGIIKEDETREFTVKSSKEEMISCYEEYVALYTKVSEPNMFEEKVKEESKNEVIEEPEANTEETVNEPKTEEEGPTQAEIEANIKKYIKPAQPVKTEEEIKASKKDKKADKQDTSKERKCKTGTAQERLDKYTKELDEKEELAKDEKKLEAMSKEDKKALHHRIASLKRKIERANRALSTQSENK